MKPSLRGYAYAVLEDAASDGRSARVADELGSVVALVTETPDLFAAMTDVGIPAPARREVLRDLLQARVCRETLRIVLRAVREERAQELAVGLGELAEMARAVVVAADAGGGAQISAEPALEGAITGRHFSAGYALAVLESLDRPEDLEEVEDQLFRFARVVEASSELRLALVDPARSLAQRRDVISTLLEDKALPATVRLARGALHSRVRDPVKALDAMVDEAAKARGWRVARVRAAKPIDDDESRQLSEALERITSTPVEIQVTEEPDLLGGAVVEIGDLLVDASAKNRLDQLEEHLLGSEGVTRGASRTWQS